MKKFFAVLFTVLLAFAMIGCGHNGDSGDVNEATINDALNETPTSDGSQPITAPTGTLKLKVNLGPERKAAAALRSATTPTQRISDIQKSKLAKLDICISEVDENGNHIPNGLEYTFPVSIINNEVEEIPVHGNTYYWVSITGKDNDDRWLGYGYKNKLYITAGQTTETDVVLNLYNEYAGVNLTMKNFPGNYTVGKIYFTEIRGGAWGAFKCAFNVSTEFVCSNAVSPTTNGVVTISITDDSGILQTGKTHWDAWDAISDNEITLVFSTENLAINVSFALDMDSYSAWTLPNGDQAIEYLWFNRNGGLPQGISSRDILKISYTNDSGNAQTSSCQIQESNGNGNEYYDGYVCRSTWATLPTSWWDRSRISWSIANDMPLLAISENAAFVQNPMAGTADTEVLRIDVAAANDNINITSIAAKICDPDTFQNVKLYSSGTQLGVTIAMPTDGQVVTFSGSPVIMIPEGAKKTLSIKADLPARNSDTPQFCITSVKGVGENSGENAIVNLPDCQCPYGGGGGYGEKG